MRALQGQHLTYAASLQFALETVVFAITRVGHHCGVLHPIRERPLHQLGGYFLGADLRVIVASLETTRRSVRLEGNGPVDLLVRSQVRYAHHPIVRLAPMLANHLLPTGAVCLPHLRSPCSSITRTLSSEKVVAATSNKSLSRRSLKLQRGHRNDFDA